MKNGVPLSDLSGLFAVNHFLYGAVILVAVVTVLGLARSILANQPFGFQNAVKEARKADDPFAGFRTWVLETRDALNRFWMRGSFFWLVAALVVPTPITYGDPTAYLWMVVYILTGVVGAWLGVRQDRKETSVASEGTDVLEDLVSRLTGIDDHRLSNAIRVTTTVAYLLLFGVAFYGDVPRALGGGRPAAVAISISEDVQSPTFENGAPITDHPVRLYYRSSSFTGVRPLGCDSIPGVLVPNDRITAIKPVDTVEDGCGGIDESQ